MPVGAMNYATEYLAELQQQFPYVLYFGALFSAPNNGRFRFLNSHTIEIPKIATTGRIDGDRDTIGARKRNYATAWTALTLENHRTWKTLVHPRDIDETNQAASIANITRAYNQDQKFPEMNAYLISKLFADWTTMGETPNTETLTEENVLEVFDQFMEAMDDKRVPRQGRILYVTPQTRTLINNAKQIYRSMALQNASGAIRRGITAIDEVTIPASVPSDMMRTLYDFTEGWKPEANARQINMLLVHPQAVITPIVYEFAQLDPPSAGSEGKYEYFEESYEDAFVLPERASALAFHVSNGTAYTYTAVESPSGNPAAQGWYVLSDGSYSLTEDTSVQSGTTYYKQS